MSFFDLRVPFFRPVWRRIVAVVICLAWAVLEYRLNALLWSVVFGGIGLFLIQQFFLSRWPSALSDDAN